MIATQTGYYKQLVPQPLFSQTEAKRQSGLGRQTKICGQLRPTALTRTFLETT
jgi:hypothetical protein